MKVDRVYIFKIIKNGFSATEVDKGADALVSKLNRAERKPKGGILTYLLTPAHYPVSVSSSASSSTSSSALPPLIDDTLTLARDGSVNQDTLATVGVYVIGHGGANAGVQGINPARLAEMINSARVPRITKLCLLACFGAQEATEATFAELTTTTDDPLSTQSNKHKSYLAALCASLGKLGHEGIKVAGWDSFVTISYDGLASTLKPKSGPGRVSKAEHQGRKIVMSTDGKKKVMGVGKKDKYSKDEQKLTQEALDARTFHKKYYTWTSANGIQALMPQGWSDPLSGSP